MKIYKKMKNRPIIILGFGGHAGVLLDTLTLLNKNIKGYVAPQKDDNFGLDFLGSDEAIQKYDPEEVILVNGLGSLPGSNRRWELEKKFSELGYEFEAVLHPSAVIATNTKLSKGVQVMAGVVIQPNVVIGDSTIINTGATIDHDSSIGAFCHISPGVTISGNVNIKDNVYIGAGTIVIQGIRIASEVAVGAGSLIYNDIDSGKQLLQPRNESLKNIDAFN